MCSIRRDQVAPRSELRRRSLRVTPSDASLKGSTMKRLVLVGVLFWLAEPSLATGHAVPQQAASASAESVPAQRANARYVGGTLSGGANVTQYKCKSTKGTLETASGSDLVFDSDGKRAFAVGYSDIVSLRYGVDAGARGAFCYPWDSYVQFTKQRHYLLTVGFRNDGGHEQAAVFEVEKTAVRSTLTALEMRTGKRVEFTDAVSCTEYKTADECGQGQPSELNGLTKVFIDAGESDARNRIKSEIDASKLGLVLVDDAQGAEIIIKYTSGLVAESGGSHAANGGMPMSAGRGEVHAVREGRSRVVLLFDDVRTAAIKKEPATRFGRAFVEAYRKAIVPAAPRLRPASDGAVG
jgi:hypothetical protein